jgi:hypothetical protein
MTCSLLLLFFYPFLNILPPYLAGIPATPNEPNHLSFQSVLNQCINHWHDLHKPLLGFLRVANTVQISYLFAFKNARVAAIFSASTLPVVSQ